MGWLNKITEVEFGRAGYQERGGDCMRLEEAAKTHPAQESEALTSIGLMARVFARHRPKDDDFIEKGAALIGKRLPKWDVARGCIDFYYWFWGSTAIRQFGGPRWGAWNYALKTALLASQRSEKDGCGRGSWDPVDAWSPVGGRVYSTAMCCMCLESYWRMDSLLDAK